MASNRNIYILNSDYSRYGVSVYQKLYSKDSLREENRLDNRGFNIKEGESAVLSANKEFYVTHNPSDLKSGETTTKCYGGPIAKHKIATIGTYIDGVPACFQDINALPTEVLTIILRHVLGGRQPDEYLLLLEKMRVSRAFYEAGKLVLYEHPKFTSTYRLGQFITSIRSNPYNGYLVKSLDLSQIRNGLLDSNDTNSNLVENAKELVTEGSPKTKINDEMPKFALATWRDWQHRFHEMYSSPMFSSYCLTSKHLGVGPSTCRGMPQKVSSGSTRPSSAGRLPSGKRSELKAKVKAKKLKHRKWISSFLPLQKGKKYSPYSTLTGSHIKPAVREFHPYKGGHPYANKFLLKYAIYKDIPIGYILHLLRQCPNITALDLSNVTLSSDFAIQTEKKYPIVVSLVPQLPSLPIAHSRTTIPLDCKLKNEHLSDSDKSYNYYTEQCLPRAICQRIPSFYPGSYTAIYPDSPPLIDAGTKFRVGRRIDTQLLSTYTLRPLSEDDIISHLFRLKNLSSLSLDNTTWCHLKHIKSILLHKFFEKNFSFYASFRDTGLVRYAPWASSGTLELLLALLLLSELSSKDDFSVEELFNIRTQLYAPNLLPELLAATNTFCLHAPLPSYCSKEAARFKLCMYRSDRFSLQISHHAYTGYPTNGYFDVIIRLGAPFPESDCAQPYVKLQQLSFRLLARIRELREAHLRRQIGVNFLLPIL